MAIDLPIRDFARNTRPGYPVESVVPLGWLRPSRLNPRRSFDPAALTELADSIKAHGLLEPIVVREVEPDGTFPAHLEIIAGERRYRACQLAGVVTVPVRSLGPLDDAAALKLALVENLQRQDLSPLEEAEGYRQLNRVVGLKQAEIAAAVHRSQSQIANRIRLLGLPEPVQAMIREGKLSAAHGVQLAKWADFPELCQEIAAKALKRNATSKDLEGHWPHFFSPYESEHVKPIPYRLDKTLCKACPFEAYRAVGEGICLKPSHLAELEKAAEAERARALAAEKAKAEAAAHEGGTAVLSTSEANANGVRIIYSDPPVGCTADCPCRAVAESPDGRILPACRDVQRFDRLRREEQQAKDEVVKAGKERLRAQLESWLKGPLTVGSRELAVIVAAALRYAGGRDVQSAAKRHAVPFPAGGIKPESALDLAQLPPEALVRFALDVILRAEINSWTGTWNGPTVAPWYLGREAADAPA